MSYQTRQDGVLNHTHQVEISLFIASQVRFKNRYKTKSYKVVQKIPVKWAIG